MGNQGILTVSFGTSVDETRAKTIGAVEEAIAKAFPNYAHETAFTSATILRILAKRGILINTVVQAIDNLREKGVTKLFIQPTHLICGEEYDKILKLVNDCKAEFSLVEIGLPLLSSNDDLCKTANIIAENIPRNSDECLILMGHGTAHFANAIYPAMDYIFKQQGYKNIYVATVEGYPEIEIVLQMASEAGYQKIVFAPMMLVAGDHAKSDMAGNSENSWKNIAESKGFSVRCDMRGLGEFPQIRQMYIEHLKTILQK